MSADSLFSVATPTRNALSKLRRCVGSIRGQSGARVEHIIQDARSDDGTPEWLASQQGGSMSFVSEADSGMYDAINRAWSRSSGEYLSWLNADEQYLPGTLERVRLYFESSPEVDVVFGDYVVADPTGRPIALRREVPFRRGYVVNSFLYAQSCTIFFRRRAFDRIGLKFDTRYRYASDMDLLLRMADDVTPPRRIPAYLAVFGIDGSNLSTHPRAEAEAEEIRHLHGASRSRLVRSMYLSARRTERLFEGSYRRCSIEFDYAIDEVPNYERIAAERLGGSYAQSDFEDRGRRPAGTAPTLKAHAEQPEMKR